MDSTARLHWPWPDKNVHVVGWLTNTGSFPAVFYDRHEVPPNSTRYFLSDGSQLTVQTGANGLHNDGQADGD